MWMVSKRVRLQCQLTCNYRLNTQKTQYIVTRYAIHSKMNKNLEKSHLLQGIWEKLQVFKLQKGFNISFFVVDKNKKKERPNLYICVCVCVPMLLRPAAQGNFLSAFFRFQQIAYPKCIFSYLKLLILSADIICLKDHTLDGSYLFAWLL